VPQLALALAGDQIVFSRRLAATGAVVALRGLSATAEEVRDGVERLFDAALHHAAAQLQEEILANPAPSLVVDTLERMAA
jgi:UDP:flavonoid glycosyltransferase YjiC (YdhE family)